MKKMIMITMLMMLTPFVLAGSMKIYPSNDAYTDNSQSNTNFNNDDLRAGYDLNHGVHRSYLGFDLSSLAGKNITNASFSIKAVSVVGGPTINLYYVSSDNWNENSITWINAPLYTNLADSKTISGPGRVSYDINSLISEPDKTLSIALVGSQEQISNLYVQFFSKEYSQGDIYWPYLEVEYEGGSCNTDADTDCNGKVSFLELNLYANNWVQGLVSFNQLIEVANAWASS